MNRLTASLFCLLFSTLLFAQTKEEPVQTVFNGLIFPPQPQHAHGSSIVNLPNGDVLAAWFQGSGERTADDVRVMGARLRKRSKTWSAPFVMADTHGLPDCNPVLFLNNHNKLFLVWIAVQAHRWECSVLRYRTSVRYTDSIAPEWNWQDNILLAPTDSFAIETASKFKQLPKSHHGTASYAPSYDDMVVEASRDLAKRSTGWMTRITPLKLSSGRILLPLYSDGFNMSLAAISDDDGDTWRASLPIVGRGNVQPAFVQDKKGDIVAYMRDNGDGPSSVQISRSADNGQSWTPAEKTTIPNTASVALLKLKDDRWAFVGNDETDGRYRLSLFVTDDEGQTWRWKRALEEVPKDSGSFSYPCLIQSADGLIHISYSYSMGKTGESIKYVVVDPASIK